MFTFLDRFRNAVVLAWNKKRVYREKVLFMDYRSYLLRVWHTLTEGKPTWRISLLDSISDQQINFTSLEELVAYLCGSFSDISTALPENEFRDIDKESQHRQGCNSKEVTNKQDLEASQ